ncbi:uncharacterized protein LOC102722198 [Oryza brachyantha]|uniref:Uncharacterized protein n=1 Tax=Oryza brachyantha TaxID=4533 RepID=J3LSD1_ORYBR|nr:uncharacterized protein LOC102722198 [Oryza brachyantha]
MAPTASMLFLSYHQLHRPAVAAPAPPSRVKEEVESNGAAAAGGRVRVSLSSALSLLARRSTEAKTPEAARKTGEARRGVGEGDAEAATLESRFEEALRLSCWSS